MIRSICLAAVLVAAVTSASVSVAAASEFDSAFAGESAFLTLAPGQIGTFTVFFLNTGSVNWIKGAGTQVDLAACRDDQVTCDIQDASEAPFDPGTWLNARRYATQSQASVAPGSIATFTYNVKVPATQVFGTYRFNGDLVVAGTGRAVHPEGYYHDLTVQGSACSPSTIALSPSFAQRQVGLTHEIRATLSCADGTPAVNASVTFVSTTTVGGETSFTRTATTDNAGAAAVSWTRSNPGPDDVRAFATGAPSVSATAVIRWTIASVVLSCSSAAETRASGGSRVYTVTVNDPNTGAAMAGTAIDVALTTAVSLGTATVNGTSAVGKAAGTTVATATTDSGGAAVFTLSATTAVTTTPTLTLTPRIFMDDDNSNTLGRGEFRVECGSTTFGN